MLRKPHTTRVLDMCSDHSKLHIFNVARRENQSSAPLPPHDGSQPHTRTRHVDHRCRNSAKHTPIKIKYFSDSHANTKKRTQRRETGDAGCMRSYHYIVQRNSKTASTSPSAPPRKKKACISPVVPRTLKRSKSVIDARLAFFALFFAHDDASHFAIKSASCQQQI